MHRILKKKIMDRNATVAVIGLGYVGLPLAVAFAQKGFKVIGIDTNAVRLERIRDLKSYIADLSNAEISQVIRRGKFTVSAEFNLLSCADVIIICVPTPLKRKYTPDISFIVKAVGSVAKYVRKNTLVVLENIVDLENDDCCCN